VRIDGRRFLVVTPAAEQGRKVTGCVGRSETFKEAEMMGVVVFQSVGEAIRQGFQIYDKTADGHIARIRTEREWAMALVDVEHTD
jgi:hypothetical protein